MGEISEFKKGIYSLDWSPDSKMLAVGGADMCTVYEPYRDIVKAPQ